MGSPCYGSFAGNGTCQEVSWFVGAGSEPRQAVDADAPAGRPCTETVVTLKAMGKDETNQRLRTCLVCVGRHEGPDAVLTDLAVLYAPALPKPLAPKCATPHARHELSGPFGSSTAKASRSAGRPCPGRQRPVGSRSSERGVPGL